MGSGLARLFAGLGWPVSLWDRDEAARDRVACDVPAARIASSLADAVAGAALVIEAIAEIAEAKQSLFAELATLTEPDTLLATNSSVIAVGTIAAACDDTAAARIVGTHFWNPPDLIPLVEVIEGPRTAPDTVARTMALLRAASKEPVHVRRDVVPGNRLQHALWREAMALVDEGICSPEDVDHIVKRSFGARLAVLGPLENADLVGLGLTEQIHRVVLPTLSRATAPAAGLSARIAAGESFYADAADRAVAVKQRLAAHLRASFATVAA